MTKGGLEPPKPPPGYATDLLATITMNKLLREMPLYLEWVTYIIVLYCSLGGAVTQKLPLLNTSTQKLIFASLFPVGASLHVMSSVEWMQSLPYLMYGKRLFYSR